MSGIQLFTPRAQGTVSITCAVTSARVALGTPVTCETVAIVNSDTSNVAFVNFGDVTVTATVPSGVSGGGMAILPATTRGVGIPKGATHVAAICSAGTPLLFFTPGNGV